jgi:urate oxidase / 2-oxo-4-hydroxy-4-carboxy-5-ureidoimidazoline decarboxylase
MRPDSVAAGPLATPLTQTELVESDGARVSLSYGKGLVVAYRLNVAAQSGVAPIPESDFAGNAGGLMAVRATVEVDGAELLPAWTDGDNSRCVATDTMKNALLYDAATFTGSTIEELAIYWATRLVERYEDFDGARVSVATINYRPAKTSAGPSEVAWVLDAGPTGVAMATIRRAEGDAVVTELLSGTEGLEIVRTSGNSFVGFPRDHLTTLPEDSDRPLAMPLTVRWFYQANAVASMCSSDLSVWVPHEQVIDLCASVLHDVPGNSIQEVQWHIAQRMFTRYPAVERVWLEGENRTWARPMVATPPGGEKTYTSGNPSYGLIRLDVDRSP